MKAQKSRRNIFSLLALGLLSYSFDFSALATETNDVLAVGVGAFYNKLPYQGWNGDELTPIPYVTYRKGNFYLEGADIGYTLLTDQQVDSGYYLDIFANARVGFGYKNDDSPALTGMEDRDDTAVEVGLKTGFYNQFGLLEVSAKQDVASAHKGFIANITYSLPIGDGTPNYQFIPYIGASYQSDKFNNYFYGVKPNEATASRLAYEVDGGTNIFVGATFIYSFTAQWSLTANAQYETLASSIEESSIVSDDNIVSGFMGVTYTF